MSIDTDWFREQLRQKGISQRSLARLVGVDSSAISLALRGKRKFQPNEIVKLSQILSMPNAEIFRRSGFEVADDADVMKVEYAINLESHLVKLPVDEHISTFAPNDIPRNSFAAQVRGPSSLLDRCIVYFSPPEASTEYFVDSLCAVVDSEGRMVVGKLKRGYTSGTFSILPLCGSGSVEKLRVTAVARVHWIRSQS